MNTPLRIAYLMEDTDLSGGVRVQLGQADALIDRGHRVTIFTKGLPVTWRSSRAEWGYVDDFRTIDATPFDFVIGTFWTTVAPAFEIAGARALHLCQGYEGSFTAYQDRKEAIDAVYRLPIAKLVVAPPLVETCWRFAPEVFCVGQIVDEEFFRAFPGTEHEPLRVMLPGAAEIDFKGIDVGYGAAAHARYLGADFELIRVSPWRPSSAEPLELVHQFEVALPANEMRQLMHSCDALLAPSRSQEGFGLPAAEAMASGLPVVMTRIASFLSFAPADDFALFADENDAIGLGDRLHELLLDRHLRNRLRRRGREVAEQFRGRHVGERLEKYLLERRERRQS